MSGASFTLQDWTLANSPIKPNLPANKQTLKFLAEHEWLRRMGMLKRHSSSGSEVSVLPKILPFSDLAEILAMGLDPNHPPVPPRTGTRFTGPVLWIILNQILIQPIPPTEYLYDIFKLILSSSADPNATHVSNIDPLSPGRKSPQALQAENSNLSLPGRPSQLLSFYHPLTFLLEQHATIDIDIITLFLDKGANLTTASSFYDGCFPLHSAVKANRLDIVDEFLIRRADVNALDNKQRTPLFVAASNGFWEVVDMLLRYGAKVNIKDEDGNTPLHAACAGGSSRIVSVLLRGGARSLATNQKGVVPSACVSEKLAEKEKEKIVAMLPKEEELDRQNIDRHCGEGEKIAVLPEKQRGSKERMEGGEEEKKEAPTLKEKEKRFTKPKHRDLEKHLPGAPPCEPEKKWPGPQQHQPLQWSIKSQAQKPQTQTQPRRAQVQKRFSQQQLSQSQLEPQKQPQKQHRHWSLLSPRPSLIASFRHSSTPAPAPAPSPSPEPKPQIATTVQLSKQIANAHCSPTSPKRHPTTSPSPSPPTPATEQGKAPKGPRVDSGLGVVGLQGKTEKPLPSLDRNKTTLSKLSQGSDDDAEDTTLVEQDEFVGWLAVDRMLASL
ncbi:uncharacterized protein BDR25DRAFT_303622 [Lindgomyces ingoldianus]|uniref:Uncharacterized protein n=1 Tax=Lindgomyces ingoldianus TaxID=673940 RepID=A0ACB6QVM8_9PLEO|nr:uncharacterized protein BDR25DRAFT_303622 [Lindgomyces ingoldianus]KAF2471094.1 hypothetical protein BDR25DRAFT_303622 [Lindgomyces ingoldianus]